MINAWFERIGMKIINQNKSCFQLRAFLRAFGKRAKM
jgi:hypothetical protein